MTFVCLWSPGWSTGAASVADRADALLEVAPRVVVEGRGVVWADARGLPARQLAESLLERLESWGEGDVRAGIAGVPVAAEAAARAGEGRIVAVEAGREREFLSPLPLSVLSPDPRLLALLEGVGIRMCGELAALEGEGVEVRFGAEGVALWRLCRADDRRLIFGSVPRERPHASLDFVDYVLTDPARLVFTANALLGSVCEALRSRGEHARRMTLALSLANGGVWRRTLRSARPTASREVWLRLVRSALERLTVPDSIAGMSLEVEAAEPAVAIQGDLFDRGFATAGAVEAALARLMEDQGPVIVQPRVSQHPLAERQTRWIEQELDLSSAPSPTDGEAVGARLTLQLLAEPRPIIVETVPRRDHVVPVRYRDGRDWHQVLTAAGPDRVSGGQWEEAYAREYFRCVTGEGMLVWLFRDVRKGTWFLHGWWD